MEINKTFRLQFQGLWHEIEAYPKDEQDGQCINHEFNLFDASTLNFTSSNVFAQSLGGTTGTVSFAFNDATGRLTLDFISNNTREYSIKNNIQRFLTRK